VLAELDRAGARATFFCVGEQAERYPALVAEVVAAGHEVALHGHRHRNLLRLTSRAAADDLARGTAALAEAGGHSPALHRPPYGIYSPAALALVRGHGLEPLLWSRWGRDWRKHIRPATIAAKVASGARPGDILLLHDADHYSAEDSWRRTVAALPAIFDMLAQRGLHAAAVSR
jgi:peptidoglycan-N-acetylglucosamine deacetylase